VPVAVDEPRGSRDRGGDRSRVVWRRVGVVEGNGCGFGADLGGDEHDGGARNGPVHRDADHRWRQGAGRRVDPDVDLLFVPRFDGPKITVLANTVDAGAGTFMIVSGTAVHVRVSSGSGKSYLERDFDGKGVSRFDAARGARLDAVLRESGVASGASKTLPVATSIKGDIGCGGQRPGSSTIALSGDTGRGAISGTLASVRVTCATDTLGKIVTAVGIAHVGAQRAVVFVDGQPNAFTIYVEPAGETAQVFKSSGGTAATTTGQGMHVSADAVEQVAAGRTAHTVHASGDAVCGVTGH
jgi:hypothetical protein